MIFDELNLTNFGVYQGRQTFKLTPQDERKPIILIGAMNGSGKTTFLDALQLAFFGKTAQCSNRNGHSYSAFLKKCVNTSTPASAGAAIDLSFRRTLEGRQQKFGLHRSWSESNGRISETFEVSADGNYDRILSEHWIESLEEILPQRIAPLFFFDGERIENLADPTSASALLRTGVSALLGTDLVYNLIDDLKVFERRKKTSVAEADGDFQVNGGLAAVTSIEEEIKQVEQERASIFGRLQRARKIEEEAQAEFEENGGALFDEQNALKEAHANIQGLVEKSSADLVALANGNAPLLLVRDQLEAIQATDNIEQEIQRTRILIEELRTRDQGLVDHLRDVGESEELLERVELYFDTSNTEMAAIAAGNVHLDMPNEGRSDLRELINSGFEEDQQELLNHLASFRASHIEMVESERRLEAIPDEETIRRYLENVRSSSANVIELENQLNAVDTQLEGLRIALDTEKANFAKELDRRVAKKLDGTDVGRMVKHSTRVRGTLDQFGSLVVEHHVSRLEQLILECFTTLVRKNDLVSRVRLDPNTFELQLYSATSSNSVLNAERLSAGERQLLAVALLWSLAKASGRPAPTIIDTPLGRLDSAHRMSLVDRYFPHASHQVILLSTDEEIDKRHYQRLEPRISRSYRIDYNEEKGGSKISDGYFFGAQHAN